MTNTEIQARGRLISSETATGGNTAARVGGVIEAIGQNLEENVDAIAAEATARASADDTLQDNIDAEASLRQQADAALQDNIDAETTSRQANDATLQAAIEAESTARSERDTTLQTNIDNEEAAREHADSTLSGLITAEASARETADATLQANISAEVSARQAADTTLQDNIDAEESAREAADTTLQDNIDAEESAREAADTTLQDNIDAEESAREAADATIQENIDAEESAREAADNALESADANLSNSIAPLWEANTEYAVGTVRMYSNVKYICSTAHSSSSVFDSSYWSVVTEPDDEPRIGSENVVKSGGVAATNGHYIESPDFIRVLTDAEHKIIAAVKVDGTICYSGDVEISGSAKHSVMRCQEFIRMYVDSDDRILFGIKSDGDILFGCGVPSEITNYVEYRLKDRYYIESPEYIDVKLDAEGNIIEATKKDGTKLFGGDIETSGALHYTKNIPEWLMCFVDSNDKIVLGIKIDGTLYANGIESEDVNKLSERCDGIEEEVNSMYAGSGIMKIVKNGNDFYIRTALSDTNDILIYMYQNTTSGGMTFHSFYVGGNKLGDDELMESCHIRDIKDSVGAIGVSSFWFLYAQHGWSIPRMRVSTQTLDSDDIGSLWTDGSHEFYIGNVSGNYIYLLPKITEDSETGIYSASWNGNLAYPTSITHVSGATHTDTISGTCGRYDLKIQSVTKRTVTANGKEITEDGTYYCDEFCISENILGYNIGKVQTWFPTPEYNGSLIDWDRTFIFKGSMCTCNTSINTQYPFIINDYRGCIPQMPLQYGDYHSYSMIPKVKKTVNSHRVDIPFDSDDGTLDDNYVSVYRNSSQLYNVDDQPERCICYLKDNSDNYLVGMAGGCSLVRGLSLPSKRNEYVPEGSSTCTYGGTSTPNKFYPKVLQGSGFSNGIVPDSFIDELSCYFCWFDPSANDGQVYWYKDGDRYILYIHNQSEHAKLGISLPEYMEGMIVQDTVERTTGANILTQQVVSGRLYVSFDTSDDVANYIVLILK